MPPSLENPERELSAIKLDESIFGNLFAYPPLPLEELFDDPNVRKRIGELICLAANRPRRRRRHRRSL
jgi:hypothetical protein